MLSPHHHEAHKLFTQDLLNLISLKQKKKQFFSLVHTHFRNSSRQINPLLTCLIAIETRMELIEASIWTFSFSFLLTIRGVKSSSLLLLQWREKYVQHTIDLPKETTYIETTVPTMLTLLTSLKRPPLYWDHCPYNAHTIDLPKETTSLLRPLSLQCSHYWPP